MSVNFYPSKIVVIKDDGKYIDPVFSFDVVDSSHPSYDPELDLNMSNGNAGLLLYDILMLPRLAESSLCSFCDINVFNLHLELARKHIKKYDRTETDVPYFEDKFSRLQKIIDYGRENGATVISWS